eukprot:732611-Rhodomonas_salina.1
MGPVPGHESVGLSSALCHVAEGPSRARAADRTSAWCNDRVEGLEALALRTIGCAGWALRAEPRADARLERPHGTRGALGTLFVGTMLPRRTSQTFLRFLIGDIAPSIPHPVTARAALQAEDVALHPPLGT